MLLHFKNINAVNLIFISLSILTVSTVHANLLVVLLQSGHVLSGFRELSLLHPLSNVPVNKSSLGIHQIELVVKSCPGLGNGSGVGPHAHSSLDLGKISTRDDGGRLVINTDLEPCWTPVNKLYRPFALYCRYCSIDILGNDISSVKHTAGHVLAMTRITLYHGIGRLEASIGNLSYGELLVVSLLSRDDWSVGDKWKVDSWIRHQVGLKLVQIYVESSIKSERGSDGRHDLRDETVQVGVGWSLDIQVSSADVVDSLVVYHECTVGMLQSSVCTQG